MKKYDYTEAITQDIIQYIKDNDVFNYNYDSLDELYEKLSEELWDNSSITGNGIDGYYDTIEKCEEYLAGNLRLAFTALIEFDEDPRNLPKDDSVVQYLDCAIRCYLLRECIDKVLGELKIKNGKI